VEKAVELGENIRTKSGTVNFECPTLFLESFDDELVEKAVELGENIRTRSGTINLFVPSFVFDC
jgi:hypothetical protein